MPAIETVADDSIKEAATEAEEQNDGCNKIPAVFDSTWQKRDHTSLNGVIGNLQHPPATSVDNGKLIDVKVMDILQMVIMVSFLTCNHGNITK